jgi:hypothetical protein
VNLSQAPENEAILPTRTYRGTSLSIDFSFE